jgi:hypothetical protein
MKNCDWIKKLFNAKTNVSFLSITEKEQLIDLSSETSLKIKLPTMSLTYIWIGVQAEYKEISVKAMKIPITFVTSYFYQIVIPAIVAIKWITNKSGT